MGNGGRFRQYARLRFTNFEDSFSPPRKVDSFATYQLGQETYGNIQLVMNGRCRHTMTEYGTDQILTLSPIVDIEFWVDVHETKIYSKCDADH